MYHLHMSPSEFYKITFREFAAISEAANVNTGRDLTKEEQQALADKASKLGWK